MNRLSAFQIEVAETFFSLPASEGFLLAGGGALLATGLTSRPTRDLDFFASPEIIDVTAACNQFESAANDRGWKITRLRTGQTFVRLHVVGSEELIVEMAIDSAANRPPVVSLLGPTFDPRELAGRKLVALFNRAESRDFSDVFVLAQHFRKDQLLVFAEEVDPGFDRDVLRQMFSALNRFTDAELFAPDEDVTQLRTFFAEWADDLSP
jgi:hypothetical protein